MATHAAGIRRTRGEGDVGSVARSMRFLVGIGMIAAGATLAVPAGRLTADAWTAAQASAGGAQPQAPAAIQAMPPAVAPSAGPGQWLLPEESLPPPVVPRADYAPPPSPDRLPPVAMAAVAQGPDMNGTYRSTLQVPPPPLLDAHAPPPATAAWATAAPQPLPSAQVGSAAEPAPSTYVIRDGDDLASISSRFYGHPAAAAALWTANRDLIPNPDLLPIGAEIRLPPPWAIPGSASSQHGGVRSIEPPPTGVFPRQVEALPASAAWLDGRQAPPPATTRPAPVAGTVRLAPGETLETLAERFYGDRRAAARIWEANRDRLRSPELVVQGMELRLP